MAQGRDPGTAVAGKDSRSKRELQGKNTAVFFLLFPLNIKLILAPQTYTEP